MGSAGEIVDRVEREIFIEAPVERVWGLVSQPGWWIGDGDRSGHVITREGEVFVVDDPRYGRYPVLPVSAEAPRYASFRSCEAPQAPDESNSTLVEFFLTEKDGGTLLRVVESGFAALAMSAEQRAATIEGTTEGWAFQLGVAKRDTEQKSG